MEISNYHGVTRKYELYFAKHIMEAELFIKKELSEYNRPRHYYSKILYVELYSHRWNQFSFNSSILVFECICYFRLPHLLQQRPAFSAMLLLVSHWEWTLWKTSSLQKLFSCFFLWRHLSFKRGNKEFGWVWMVRACQGNHIQFNQH